MGRHALVLLQEGVAGGARLHGRGRAASSVPGSGVMWPASPCSWCAGVSVCKEPRSAASAHGRGLRLLHFQGQEHGGDVSGCRQRQGSHGGCWSDGRATPAEAVVPAAVPGEGGLLPGVWPCLKPGSPRLLSGARSSRAGGCSQVGEPGRAQCRQHGVHPAVGVCHPQSVCVTRGRCVQWERFQGWGTRLGNPKHPARLLLCYCGRWWLRR